MNNMKYLPVYLVVIFIFNVTTISTENKTSSECWACKPNTPHVLDCTGAGVIVIQSAHYGYKVECSVGITGGGCTVNEINRCCKPGDPGRECFKSFNVRDRKKLETTCSSKSTCLFNSIRHDQPDNCNLGINYNSFTLINYTCQTPETTTTAKLLSASTEKQIYTTSLVKSTTATSIPAISSSTNNQGDTTSLDVKTTLSKDTTSSDGVKKMSSSETTSSDDKMTSGEIGGIVVGVVAIVILLFIAAFLLYQRHETTKLTRNRQNHQQSTSRTVGVQYSETDFNDITAQSNIAASSSKVSTSYSQLNRLGSESIKYEDLIMKNGQRKAITDNNSNGYYNQQYVNM